MSTLIIGGTGFIGRRLDPAPGAARRGDRRAWTSTRRPPFYGDLGKQVRVLRGDVSQFDDVMAAMTAAKPDAGRSTSPITSAASMPPRVAFKLNILGMDNCFEAARLAGVNRVVYASSLAVSGEQKFYGDRVVDRGRFPPRPCAIRDAQDLQRMAGAGLPREARHGDHDDPPGQRHRPRQDRRLGRPRLLHHHPGARQAGHVPVQGRDALPDPCRRDRRNLRPRDHEGQAGARDLQHRRPHDQPRRAGRHRARVPARRADHLRQGDRRQGRSRATT